MTQEELARELNVSRQSVSKWEGAQSIPDMDKIIQLSSIFSISVDYLVKDELEDPEYVESRGNASLRRLNLEAANEFIEANEKYAGKIAFGVFLSISSSVLLVFLDALGAGGYLSASKDMLSTLGIIVLFLLVSLAVGIFIRSSSIISRYSYLKTEAFDKDYGVDSVLRQKQEEYKDIHTKKLALGVSLLILSVIPVLVSELFKKISYFGTIGVPLFLIMVASGVFILIKTSIHMSSFSILLEEGDYSPDKKNKAKIHDRVAGVYWLSAVVIYLSWSFITEDWGRTWIIWPIAGVGFGLVSIIVSILIDD